MNIPDVDGHLGHLLGVRQCSPLDHEIDAVVSENSAPSIGKCAPTAPPQEDAHGNSPGDGQDDASETSSRSYSPINSSSSCCWQRTELPTVSEVVVQMPFDGDLFRLFLATFASHCRRLPSLPADANGRQWMAIILDPASGILDPILFPGSRIQDPGSWIQDPGSRIQDP